MVIAHSGTDTVTLKTKTETVTIGPGIRIGSFTIPGAGEYDVASIQCEGIPLTASVAYFIRAEELTTLILDELDSSVTKLDDVAQVNILVADLRSDANIDTLKVITKALEPSYLVLSGAGATEAVLAALGLPRTEGDTLKITRVGLPLEGTSVLIRA